MSKYDEKHDFILFGPIKKGNELLSSYYLLLLAFFYHSHKDIRITDIVSSLLITKEIILIFVIFYSNK